MALESPVLDDRRFQDIVDELRKRIPEYCPEWTDINLSDPGVTLIELFAWMTETILYRLNRVPLLHYIKFMELFGVTLKAPAAANVPVTFLFSAPQARDIEIPAGTQVSTTQTEDIAPVIFATKEEFVVRIPHLDALLSGTEESGGRRRYQDLSHRTTFVTEATGENIFSNRPRSGDAFYLGFTNDLSHHTIRIGFVMVELEASGLKGRNPPWIWEVSTGNDQEWRRCQLDGANNTLEGFNRSGQIQVHLPQMEEMELVGFNGRSRFWLRVRLTDAQRTEQSTGYGTSPHLRYISGCHAVGGTINTEHAQIVREETVGTSTGVPGQRFHLQAAPVVMPLKANERLRVQMEGEIDRYWTRVDDFSNRTALDTCFTLDGITGELRFGPAIRLQNGEILQLGAVPPKGAILIFERYRSGGGIAGNVERGAIDTLKTAIPYVNRVFNHQRATGGLDAQSIEEAMLEMPKRLRSRERAVTRDDFESLIEEHFHSRVGRAICLAADDRHPEQPDGDHEPNRIDIRLVPRLENAESHITPDLLEASTTLQQEVHAFLDERRLLTTRLRVASPSFVWVVIEVDVKVQPGTDTVPLRDTILRRLYRFLNPLTGGANGNGWPIGRTLKVWEIYQYLQVETNDRREVLELRQIVDLTIAMFKASEDGSATGQALSQLPVSYDGLIASGRHHVRFITS